MVGKGFKRLRNTQIRGKPGNQDHVHACRCQSLVKYRPAASFSSFADLNPNRMQENIGTIILLGSCRNPFIHSSLIRGKEP